MKVVALAGGVGGARLVDGLAQQLAPDTLTILVNTGDDFVHWGLHISPDLDTIMYTLAGLAHPTRGWGLATETFETLAAMERLGGPAWFRLGDRDLATHIRRTEQLHHAPLHAVTAELCQSLGVGHRVLPMSDAPCHTGIETEAYGLLSFQDWLVGRRGAPTVRKVHHGGAGADPAPGTLEAVRTADLVVLAPSNPYVSIDPILHCAEMRAAVSIRPVIALSPIVGGRAVKGPLAAMIPALAGRPASAQAVMDHYEGLVDAAVIETGDVVSGLPTLGTQTIMGDRSDRARLAGELLGFAARELL